MKGEGSAAEGKKATSNLSGRGKGGRRRKGRASKGIRDCSLTSSWVEHSLGRSKECLLGRRGSSGRATIGTATTTTSTSTTTTTATATTASTTTSTAGRRGASIAASITVTTRVVAVAEAEVRLGGTLHVTASGAGDVHSLGSSTLISVDVVLDLLTLTEAAEALSVNAALVNKDIIATIIRSNEAKALLGVEPLAGTGQLSCRHLVTERTKQSAQRTYKNKTREKKTKEQSATTTNGPSSDRTNEQETEQKQEHNKNTIRIQIAARWKWEIA